MTTIRQLSSIRIDFDRVEEVTGYATLITRLASEAGLFLSEGAAPADAATLRQAAREWLRQIDPRLDRMTAADALSATDSYDLMHRIAWQTPAPVDVINRQVLRAFDSLVHGDPSIDRYTLFRRITAGLSRRDPAYLGKLLQWHSLCLDRWHKEFRRMLTAFRPASSLSSSASLSSSSVTGSQTTYDIIQRATILLESDLRVFEPTEEPRFKRQVFDLLRPRLTSLSTHDRHDRPTLRALDRLLAIGRRLGYLTDTAADGCTTPIATTHHRTYASALRH